MGYKGSSLKWVVQFCCCFHLKLVGKDDHLQGSVSVCTYPSKNLSKVGQNLQLGALKDGVWMPMRASLSYLSKIELGSTPSAFRTKFTVWGKKKKRKGNWGVLADFPYGFISNCEVCSAWNISAAISLSYARLMISITHTPEWWIFTEPGRMKDFKRREGSVICKINKWGRRQSKLRFEFSAVEALAICLGRT